MFSFSSSALVLAAFAMDSVSAVQVGAKTTTQGSMPESIPDTFDDVFGVKVSHKQQWYLRHAGFGNFEKKYFAAYTVKSEGAADVANVDETLRFSKWLKVAKAMRNATTKGFFAKNVRNEAFHNEDKIAYSKMNNAYKLLDGSRNWTSHDFSPETMQKRDGLIDNWFTEFDAVAGDSEERWAVFRAAVAAVINDGGDGGLKGKDCE